MALAEVAVAPAWVGHKVTALEEQSGARVAMITRFGNGILTQPGMLVQDGDLLHVMMLWEERENVERVLAAGPSEEDH